MDRLVILTYDFKPNNGGIARLCNEIENCCVSTGLNYLVVTNVPGEESPNIKRIVGKRGFVEYKIYRYLKENLKEGDVILTGTYHPDGIIGYLTGAPTYYLAHGAEFLKGKTFFRQHIWPFYRDWVLKQPVKIIANSHYTENLVRSCVKSANVVALPLAVDEKRFKPTREKYDDGKLHLCTIARLERFKAQDFVIKTIGSLPVEYRSKIVFEIAGKGVYRPELERMVAEYGLQEQVKFLGFVADSELCDFYSRNDMFILTTREDPDNVEGFGLVFTEAQACGTACIGSRSGGIPDAVEEGNGGWLIDQDNEKQLIELLINCIDNPQIVKSQCAKARQRIEASCTWSQYFNKLQKLLS